MIAELTLELSGDDRGTKVRRYFGIAVGALAAIEALPDLPGQVALVNRGVRD